MNEGTPAPLQIPTPKQTQSQGDVRGRSQPASRGDMPVTALDDEIVAGANASTASTSTGPRGRSQPASRGDMPVTALDDGLGK